jgi:hypothetical protein
VLLCAECGKTTEHVYSTTENRKYQFHSEKENVEKPADGMKDIFQCSVCGETRVYGAPGPDFPLSALGWTMREEKKCITEILKNFGHSRAVLFCPNPEEWVEHYLQGLDRRTIGFDGQPMARRQRLELKLFALTLVKKCISKDKTAAA